MPSDDTTCLFYSQNGVLIVSAVILVHRVILGTYNAMKRLRRMKSGVNNEITLSALMCTSSRRVNIVHHLGEPVVTSGELEMF